MKFKMSSLKLFFSRIKKSIKTRRLIFRDNLEVVLRFRHPLIPPKRYDYINAGANEQIAKEYLNLFVTLGNLKPTDKILEVGSGFGRMAIPLTTFLSNEGRYSGIEIIKDGVNWCQSKFTPKYLNFEFQHINVYNERYNPKGSVSASEFKFPFEDYSFDFVYLTSVFTHMFKDDITQYLSEIARVLKTDGKCFITYFLINDETKHLISSNNSYFTFKNPYNGCFVEDLTKPEFAVAYEEQFIRALYEKVGLNLSDPLNYGNWSGNKNFISFQDIVVATKR